MKADLLTVKELANYFKVSVGTVYYWANQRKIPVLKAGRHLRFSLGDVIESFDKHSKEEGFTGIKNSATSGGCSLTFEYGEDEDEGHTSL